MLLTLVDLACILQWLSLGTPTGVSQCSVEDRPKTCRYVVVGTGGDISRAGRKAAYGLLIG